MTLRALLDIDRPDGEDGAAYVLTLWAEQIAGEIRSESYEVTEARHVRGYRKPAPHVVPTEAEMEQARMRLEEA